MFKLFCVRKGYRLFVGFYPTREMAETISRIDEKKRGKAKYIIQAIRHENNSFSKLTGGR